MFDETTSVLDRHELLKIEEAARCLRCSAGLVRTLVARGELEEVRLGRKQYIRSASLRIMVRGEHHASH